MDRMSSLQPRHYNGCGGRVMTFSPDVSVVIVQGVTRRSCKPLLPRLRIRSLTTFDRSLNSDRIRDASTSQQLAGTLAAKSTERSARAKLLSVETPDFDHASPPSASMAYASHESRCSGRATTPAHKALTPHLNRSPCAPCNIECEASLAASSPSCQSRQMKRVIFGFTRLRLGSAMSSYEVSDRDADLGAATMLNDVKVDVSILGRLSRSDTPCS